MDFTLMFHKSTEKFYSMELGEEQKRTSMSTPQREIFALQRKVDTCTYIAEE
jgi:hypothetical protein